MDYFSYAEKIKKFPIQSSFLFSNITGIFKLIIYHLKTIYTYLIYVHYQLNVIVLGDIVYRNFTRVFVRNTNITSIDIHTTNVEYCW